jgi:hypothetical protein
MVMVYLHLRVLYKRGLFIFKEELENETAIQYKDL